MTRAAARTIDPTRFTALLPLPTALASIQGRQGGFIFGSDSGGLGHLTFLLPQQVVPPRSPDFQQASATIDNASAQDAALAAQSEDRRRLAGCRVRRIGRRRPRARASFMQHPT